MTDFVVEVLFEIAKSWKGDPHFFDIKHLQRDSKLVNALVEELIGQLPFYRFPGHSPPLDLDAIELQPMTLGFLYYLSDLDAYLINGLVGHIQNKIPYLAPPLNSSYKRPFRAGLQFGDAFPRAFLLFEVSPHRIEVKYDNFPDSNIRETIKGGLEPFARVCSERSSATVLLESLTYTDMIQLKEVGDIRWWDEFVCDKSRELLQTTPTSLEVLEPDLQKYQEMFRFFCVEAKAPPDAVQNAHRFSLLALDDGARRSYIYLAPVFKMAQELFRESATCSDWRRMRAIEEISRYVTSIADAADIPMANSLGLVFSLDEQLAFMCEVLRFTQPTLHPQSKVLATFLTQFRFSPQAPG
jgi:hypothetical protein